tara:strand:+ start:360 stop:650 length:291 start_codon:yes stop_codon:yes gene_type:complete
MAVNEQFSVVLSDYEYITEKYGDPVDFTGSNAESDGLQKLLRNPSKKTSAKLMAEWIVNIIQLGGERGVPLDLADPRTKEIAIRYNAINEDDFIWD